MLLPALQKIDGSCVIDGELCALDAHGRWQNALNKKAKLLYVVFDALFVGGKDIREKPLLERKKILKSLMPRGPLLHYSEHVAEFGTREFAKAQRAHEEGVIAKRATGLYYSGSGARFEVIRRLFDAGDNVIEVKAYNGQNLIESEPAQIVIKLAPEANFKLAPEA